MYTEAINHDPAITFMQTGSQLSGRPSIGSWLRYGLGTDNENLPAFVVLITPGKVDQPVMRACGAAGFFPRNIRESSSDQARNPCLYLANPAGVSAESRRLMLDRLREVQDSKRANSPIPNWDRPHCAV
jgi:hypothetical protein